MRSYSHILEKVFCEPWLITGSAHDAIVRVVVAHMEGQLREGEGMCGKAVEVPEIEIDEELGLAVIPIGGVMGRKLTGFERGAGAVDTLDVAAEMDLAENDERVRAIILDVDSPGGMVNGTPELGNRIAAATKPVYAFAGGDMASAAYWVSAPSKAIYAAPSASVGSIGVYVPHYDQTRRYEEAGVKVELFTSGKYKGMGFPGTSLSDAQRELLQARVMDLAGDFKGWVRQNRGEIAGDVMEGQVFRSEEAVRNGLIDGIVGSLDELKSIALAGLA